LDLKRSLPQTEQKRIKDRYVEEFSRYVGSTAEIPTLRARDGVTAAPAFETGA